MRRREQREEGNGEGDMRAIKEEDGEESFADSVQKRRWGRMRGFCRL